MADWHDRVAIDKKQRYYEVFGYVAGRVDPAQYPEGSVFFRRRKKRKLRTRYIVCKTDDGGNVFITNAEVRYRKSKKAWGVFIDDEVVAHYRTLKAAKLALMPGVLDRMGAEGDRCLDPPYSEPSSKNEASAY